MKQQKYDRLVKLVNEDVEQLNAAPTDDVCLAYLTDRECLCNIAEDLYNGHTYLFGVLELNQKAQEYFDDWYANRFEGFNY